MSTTRRLQASTVARAAAPVLLLLAAMAIPPLAGVATLVLVGGTAVALERKAPVAWAWAAMIPATALATVRWLSRVVPFGTPAACEAFGAPRVAWAVVDAVVVVAAFTALAVALRTRRASIGLRKPARRAVRNAVLGFGAFAIGGFVVVSLVNGGLPGPTNGDPSTVQFVLAVLVGALAIAIAEEVAFRGVLQHWLARTTGEWPAVGVQGVAYGVWVTAAGWGPLFGIVAAAAGLVAGAITVRTNSILTALAWHAGIAIPLFAVLLCP